MTYDYRLNYPNGKTTDITIRNPLSAGDNLTLGDKFLVANIDHQLKPQKFDSSITHETVSIVTLELIS